MGQITMLDSSRIRKGYGISQSGGHSLTYYQKGVSVRLHQQTCWNFFLYVRRWQRMVACSVLPRWTIFFSTLVGNSTFITSMSFTPLYSLSTLRHKQPIGPLWTKCCMKQLRTLGDVRASLNTSCITMTTPWLNDCVYQFCSSATRFLKWCHFFCSPKQQHRR